MIKNAIKLTFFDREVVRMNKINSNTQNALHINIKKM